MPIKTPGSPDYACLKCGHTFKKRKGVVRRIAQALKPEELQVMPPKCPKCGSAETAPLTY